HQLLFCLGRIFVGLSSARSSYLPFGARMNARTLNFAAALLLFGLYSRLSSAQGVATAPPPTSTDQAASVRLPQRAIRRDMPMTDMIRRAHAAATRDSSGRPGRRYWQLWTDYKINARLDTATSRITGRETIVLYNNSDSALNRIV